MPWQINDLMSMTADDILKSGLKVIFFSEKCQRAVITFRVNMVQPSQQRCFDATNGNTVSNLKYFFLFFIIYL